MGERARVLLGWDGTGKLNEEDYSELDAACIALREILCQSG